MKIDIQELKSHLNRDDVVSILTNVGYEVDTRAFKFCLRDEKTASAVINLDNSIHDYGNGYHGDILDLLVKYNAMSLSDAIKFVANYLGISESNSSYTPKPRKKLYREPHSELSEDIYKRITETIKHFDKDSSTICEKELYSIVPKWCYVQAPKTALERFKQFTTYDKSNTTLVIKIFNYDGKLISFKRRRLNAKKWITAKGTHPNNQCLFNLLDDTNPIYVVEGHHDFLTGILLDINIFMIPTVNYKKFTPCEISLFNNREIIFLPDWKADDLKGVEAMRKLALDIESITFSTRLFSLPKFLNNEKIAFTNDKLDLSEVVELWSEERVSLKVSLGAKL